GTCSPATPRPALDCQPSRSCRTRPPHRTSSPSVLSLQQTINRSQRYRPQIPGVKPDVDLGGAQSRDVPALVCEVRVPVQERDPLVGQAVLLVTHLSVVSLHRGAVGVVRQEDVSLVETDLPEVAYRLEHPQVLALTLPPVPVDARHRIVIARDQVLGAVEAGDHLQSVVLLALVTGEVTEHVHGVVLPDRTLPVIRHHHVVGVRVGEPPEPGHLLVPEVQVTGEPDPTRHAASSIVSSWHGHLGAPTSSSHLRVMRTRYPDSGHSTFSIRVVCFLTGDSAGFNLLCG